MKVLFLDIDGVLNSHRTVAAFGQYPWSVEDEEMQFFDTTAVALIRKLCSRTDTKIVLSSTWRRSPKWTKIAERLKLPIIDKTPEKLGSYSRGQEIHQWLTQNPQVKKYAIIDDDSDMLPSQKDHFVQTSMKNGLLIEHFDALFEILGGN